MQPKPKEVFVCIDCETTGLDLVNDRIIEIAVIKFTMDEVLEQFESLIDPEMVIPEASIAIHHITQSMCEGKPKIGEVLKDVLKIVGKHPIVGHGVKFDVEMVANACDRSSIMHTLRANPTLDTLRMARLYGESPTNSLETLRKHFNIDDEGAHRAMSDVLVNIDVFKYLARQYRSTKQIFDALSKPIQLKVMPLGKHKGRPLKELPIDYLRWAATKDFDQDLLFSLRSEINRRKKGGSFQQAGNPFSSL